MIHSGDRVTNRDSNVTQSVSNLVVRPECGSDVEGIRRVLIEAFGSETEANLVGALRANGALTLSLVGRVAGESVGHVAFSPMHSGGQSDREDLLGLAPVAVHPMWQRRGIDSALIKRGLGECRKRRVAVVFVLGEPGFYARFGFIDAQSRALRCKYDAAAGAFQLLLLGDARALPPAGLIDYRSEFDSPP